jgi:predicted nicotinamide N-methyase
MKQTPNRQIGFEQAIELLEAHPGQVNNRTVFDFGSWAVVSACCLSEPL